MLGGQRLRPTQPNAVPDAAAVDRNQHIQLAGPWDPLAARVLDLRLLDQAVAGLNASELADALDDEEVFAWAS